MPWKLSGSPRPPLQVVCPDFFSKKCLSYDEHLRKTVASCMNKLIQINRIKTAFIWKLSNFNFQWTKTLYQNNLNNTAFFCTFCKGYRYNLSSCNNTKDYFLWEPDKINVKFHQNCETTGKILKISCVRWSFSEIWHSFSRTPIRNFVWCYYR